MSQSGDEKMDDFPEFMKQRVIHCPAREQFMLSAVNGQRG